MLELESFLAFQMFTHHQIDRPVTNVQNDYASWNEGRISPFDRGPEFESDGEAFQIHAPNDSSFDKWTLSRWKAGLNKNLQTYIDASLNGDPLVVNTSIQLHRRREMVKYAVNDCLAVTRLSSATTKLSQQQQHQSALSFNPQQISSSPPISSPLSSQQQPSSSPLPSTTESTFTVLVSSSSHPTISATTTSSSAKQPVYRHLKQRNVGVIHVKGKIENRKRRLIIGFNSSSHRDQYRQHLSEDYFHLFQIL
ncbi:unnamed protein product [Didymodactylos carnosus]|uniref:Uncharacterized protein n=1 Tax=Didymodactylos carnosus TaxID=1234261 RepID=A0A8S2Y226_9BILA|nr:unnamed protein product [Didymodactylos carnosus]CAF4313482.1 unnamed protein product [Didymodactylos carnosus]CAF4524126.1 unnamed protein product [Didymodactylos carnosus]